MEECTIEWYERGTSFYRMNQTEDFRIDSTYQQSDWGNSVYFFLEEEDRKRYQEEDHKYPMTLRNLQRFAYIKCNYECFSDGSYTDDDMARLFRDVELLIHHDKPERVPFMQWLGDHEYAFQCYNVGTWEIAIPIPLLLRPDSWEITNI